MPIPPRPRARLAWGTTRISPSPSRPAPCARNWRSSSMPKLSGRPKLWCLLLAAGAAGSLSAQQPPELKQVIDRLDRLEAQNQELMAEIRALRQQLAAGQAAAPETAPLSAPQTADAEAPPQPVADRVAVAE